MPLSRRCAPPVLLSSSSLTSHRFKSRRISTHCIGDRRGKRFNLASALEDESTHVRWRLVRLVISFKVHFISEALEIVILHNIVPNDNIRIFIVRLEGVHELPDRVCTDWVAVRVEDTG